MQEIEVKILNISVPIITKKLLAIGAKKLGANIIKTKLFNFPNKPITKDGNLLRLRQVGKKTECTYKIKKETRGKFKIADEAETEIANVVEFEKILARLGLKCIKYIEKKRTSFVLKRLKFEIDEHTGIPPYLEIEGTPRSIEQAVKLLGFTMADTSNQTATQVLKSYGVTTNFLTFKK